MMAAVEDLRPFLVTGKALRASTLRKHKNSRCSRVQHSQPRAVGHDRPDIGGNSGDENRDHRRQGVRLQRLFREENGVGTAKAIVSSSPTRFFSADVENQKFELDVDIPALRIEAEYSIDGKVLLMPIRGHGDMTANVSK